MRSLTLGLPVVLAACAAGDAPITTLSLGEATYRVPDAHIVSVSREPHQFVRVKPPEGSFELIYDSRTAARADRFGWPVIFSLNDERAPNIDRQARGGLMIVCRRDVHPKGGCGLKVTHRGGEWAVLFPETHLEKALVIRQGALAALTAYEA